MRKAVVLLCGLLLLLVLFPKTSGADLEPMNEGGFVNVSYTVGLGGVNSNFFAWGDYDDDGYQDLLVGGRRVFRNQGFPGYTFTETTNQLGISKGAGKGNWGDFNNDGLLDLYSVGGVDYLYQNNGDSFSDVTASAGVNNPDLPGQAVGWADYDRDGDLDMYVANGEDWNDGDPIYYMDILYQNNGDGTFTNATSDAGVDTSANPVYGRGVDWCDFDKNGWIDLYVPNYRQRNNYLWQNIGDGTFDDVADDLGTADGAQLENGNVDPYNRPGHSVGAAWADFDNDQDFDMWVTNLNHKDARTSDDSLLYRNEGESQGYRFTNVRGDSGIETKPYLFPNEGDELMVGVAIGDYDNDGFQDIFLPQIYDDVSYAYSYFYRNLGGNGFTFEEVSDEVGVKVWNTYGGCFCDYDQDGDLDLLTAGKNESTTGATKELRLYENQVNNGNHWIQLDLRGTESNSHAVGAVAYVYSESRTYMRQVEGGMGCHAMQNQFPLHYGLGEDINPVDVKIEWPSGKVQWEIGLLVDQIHTIYEDTTNPDLEITDVGSSKDIINLGDEVFIGFNVTNLGPYDVESYQIDVSYAFNGSEEGSPIQTISNYADLEANATKYHVVSWTPTEPGLLDVYAKISKSLPSDDNPLNSEDFVTVRVKTDNPEPVPVLRVSNENPRVDAAVRFYGSGSTDDEEVVRYKFDFGDGDTTGWTNFDEAEHVYSEVGMYTASLTVEDNQGAISTTPSTIELTVTDDGQPPPPPPPDDDDDVEPGGSRAYIDSIFPNPAEVGEDVFFAGHGETSTGVLSYEWYCPSIGVLSEESSFIYSFEFAGVYTLEFRVLDNTGEWSDTAKETLRVQDDVIIPSLTITNPVGDSFITDESFNIEGLTSDDTLDVEFRMDGGDWAYADGVNPFTIWVDISEFDAFSNHTVEVRSFNGEAYSDITEISFTVMAGDDDDDDDDDDGLSSRDNLILLIVLVIIVFLVVVFLLMIRKRNPNA